MRMIKERREKEKEEKERAIQLEERGEQKSIKS